MTPADMLAKSRALKVDEACARFAEFVAALPECTVRQAQRHHWVIDTPNGGQIQYWPGGNKWTIQKPRQSSVPITGTLEDLIYFIRQHR